MKKRLICALFLATVLSVFASCGGKDATDEGNTGESQTQESSTGGSSEEIYFTAATPLKDLNLEEFVTLGEYKGIQVNIPEAVPPDEEEVELTTKNIYFGNIEECKEVKDRPVELLDMVNIDYEGKKDGVAFDGGTAQGSYLLIGSGQFIDGFEDGLIGVEPGETVDLMLKFPDGYQNEELAGQEVVFTVTVNYIAEMLDEQVTELGIPDVNTVDLLRGYVRDGIFLQAQEDYLSNVQNSVLEQLIANCDFIALPEDRVQSNTEVYENWLDQIAASYGLDGATYLSLYGMDYEAVVNEQAELNTRVQLAVQAVANAENLNISDEDLERRLLQNALLTGVSVEDLLVNGLTKEDYRESYVHEDVLNFLVDQMVNTAGKS